LGILLSILFSLNCILTPCQPEYVSSTFLSDIIMHIQHYTV
jgi:hypothetical protein